jgi:hypothetical protein
MPSRFAAGLQRIAFPYEADWLFVGVFSVDSLDSLDSWTDDLSSSTRHGLHLCFRSAESKSASQVAVAIVRKHFVHMESVVPSGLDRCTKSDWDDAAGAFRESSKPGPEIWFGLCVAD